MNDRDFLLFVYHRLAEIHGESERTLLMGKLRAIIASMPAWKSTPNTGRWNSIAELESELFPEKVEDKSEQISQNAA